MGFYITQVCDVITVISATRRNIMKNVVIINLIKLTVIIFITTVLDMIFNKAGFPETNIVVIYYVKENEVHITPIEYKILCILAKNIGRVLTHTYIAKEIWGIALEGDIASLRVHVATLRKKIENEDHGNRCIQTRIGIGYCMIRQE